MRSGANTLVKYLYCGDRVPCMSGNQGACTSRKSLVPTRRISAGIKQFWKDLLKACLQRGRAVDAQAAAVRSKRHCLPREGGAALAAPLRRHCLRGGYPLRVHGCIHTTQECADVCHCAGLSEQFPRNAQQNRRRLRLWERL